MGTRLIARGVAPDLVWRAPLDHPELVLDIHRSDVAADAITAATFGLSWHPEAARDVASAALRLARQAAGQRPVIASLAPGKPERVAPLLADADVLLLETFDRLDALQAALERCEFVGPRWATLSILGDRTGDGATPEDAARDLDADMIGVNCGAGLHETAALAKRMVGGTQRVLAQPSAGVESPASPEVFADVAQALWSHGVAVVGGCCGVGHAHLEAARRHIL